MITAEPQLYVTDLGAALAFYSGKLGFEVTQSYGDPPFWAQVVRDGARLNMRAVDGPVFDSAFRVEEADAISVTLAVDDAEPLYREFHKNGVAFHQELRTEEWGARTFIVRDPSGNLILFAGGD